MTCSGTPAPGRGEPRDLPALIHVRDETFSAGHAPAVYRTVVGLSPFFRNVVCARASDVRDGTDGLAIEVYGAASGPRMRDLAARLARRHRNIVAVLGHLGSGGIAGLPVAARLGVPLLTIFGGRDANVGIWDRRLRRGYEGVLGYPGGLMLAVSSNLVQRLLDRGVPAERVRLWHRGLELSEFAPCSREAIAGGRLRVLMVGRFLEFKGHEFALGGFARLVRRFPRAELHLLGAGPLGGRIRTHIRRLGIAPAVHVHGRVPMSTVRAHMRQAAIALHPSVESADGMAEGVPNALIEAHAMGLPVVATRHGGIPDVVMDGQSGILVPERDADAVGKALCRLAGDADLRRRMGLAGRRHVEMEFNLTGQARRLAGLIRQAAAGFDPRSLRDAPLPLRPTARAGPGLHGPRLLCAGVRAACRRMASDDDPRLLVAELIDSATLGARFLGSIIRRRVLRRGLSIVKNALGRFRPAGAAEGGG